MFRYRPRGDSPEQLQRYLQLVFQRIDRKIIRLGRVSDSESVQEIQYLCLCKLSCAHRLQLQDFDNLDALKWELYDSYPNLQAFF